jgi:hypothetical protein
MTPYPIEFQTQTTATHGIQTHWKSKIPSGELDLSVPPEFKGPGGSASPEDLFNAALANCFIGTFKVYAENSKLTFLKLEVSSKLVLDLDEKKMPVMKEFFLTAIIVDPSNSERALLLAKKASESGFILNSVKTHCHFDLQVKSTSTQTEH